MRLKKIAKQIIVESNEEREAAMGLEKLITGGKYKNDKIILVRGEQTVRADYYVVRNIRKNRKPTDTAPLIDSMVEAIRKVQYPEILSRRKAKFCLAAADKSEVSYFSRIAKNYGNPHIVFCESDAPIFSHKEDTYKYFAKLRKKIQNAKHLAKILNKSESDDFINSYPELYEFVQLISEPNVPEEAISHMFEKNMPSIRSQIDSFLEKNEEDYLEGFYDVRKIYTPLKQFNQIFDEITKYFNEGSETISAGDEEVLFGGETYIAVNLDFFMRNFDFYNGEYIYTQN